MSSRGIEESSVKWSTHKVFIGDPCYALDKDVYHEIWGNKMDYSDGVIEDKGESYAVVHHTYYGDGCYTGTDHKEYFVDSGTLGVINLALCDKDPEELKDLGRVVEVPSGYCKVSFEVDDGSFWIIILDVGEDYIEEVCSVEIPTKVVNGYEEDDEDYDYDGDDEDYDYDGDDEDYD